MESSRLIGPSSPGKPAATRAPTGLRHFYSDVYTSIYKNVKINRNPCKPLHTWVCHESAFTRPEKSIAHAADCSTQVSSRRSAAGDERDATEAIPSDQKIFSARHGTCRSTEAGSPIPCRVGAAGCISATCRYTWIASPHGASQRARRDDGRVHPITALPSCRCAQASIP